MPADEPDDTPPADAEQSAEPSAVQLADEVERRLGHRFADLGLLTLALTHRSRTSEAGTGGSNERLEFLGDAVLGWVVADVAYRMFRNEPESVLNNVRKVVVNERALAGVARRLGLGSLLLLGKGEDRAGGRDKNSILADAMEAVIGAVYLDAGADAAHEFVARHFTPAIERASTDAGSLDHKSNLQEELVRRGHHPPRYETTGTGPDHDRVFTARAVVDGETLGEGTGSTKREAEQEAAQAALLLLRDH